MYQKANTAKIRLNLTSELKIFYLGIIYCSLPTTIVNVWFFEFFLTHNLVPISWNIPLRFKMLSSSFETHFQVICEGVSLTIWAKSKFKIISKIIKFPTSYSNNDSLVKVAWECDSQSWIENLYLQEEIFDFMVFLDKKATSVPWFHLELEFESNFSESLNALFWKG